MSNFRVIPLLAVLATSLRAQSEVSIQSPTPPRYVGRLLRPFHLEKRVVAPARLTDTPRLESLLRAGNLYLSVEDVIALTLENNLDIAIQRYGPYLAKEVLRRTQGGGIMRSADSPVVAGPSSVSLAGISLSTGSANIGSIGTIITQTGPSPPSLDPSLFVYAQFAHTTSPQTNTVLNRTNSLTIDSRQYQFNYSQSFLTGTNVSGTYSSSRNLLNSPSNLFNPTISATLDFSINQPLLQGFSKAVNNRDILAAKNSAKVTDLQMKLQVITTVSALLNLYWDLVSFNEDVRIKERALAVAQKLLDDNRNQVRIGTLQGIAGTASRVPGWKRLTSFRWIISRFPRRRT